jgi:electron transport complex protein RnfB
MFSPEEACIVSGMGREMEPLRALAERPGLSAEEAEGKLLAMAGRGLLWRDRKEGERRFKLAPIIVGI